MINSVCSLNVRPQAVPSVPFPLSRRKGKVTVRGTCPRFYKVRSTNMGMDCMGTLDRDAQCETDPLAGMRGGPRPPDLALEAFQGEDLSTPSANRGFLWKLYKMGV